MDSALTMLVKAMTVSPKAPRSKKPVGYDRKVRTRLLRLFESRSGRYYRTSPGSLQKKASKLLAAPCPLRSVREITRKLGGFDYAILGGHALTLHGQPRMTEDLDLLVCPDDVAAILRQLGATRSTPLAIGGASTVIKRVTLDLVAPCQPWVDSGPCGASRTMPTPTPSSA
jgi:hypothetical protein